MKKFQHVGFSRARLQKGKFRNKEYTKNSVIAMGEYGIQLRTKGLIFINEIIAAKKILAKALKGVGILWVRFMPERPITKKPSEVRMGKGKGKFDTWVYNVKAGAILFEISRIVMNKSFKEIIKNAISKLSFRTLLIKNRA